MSIADGRTEMLNDFLDRINDGDYNIIIAMASHVDNTGNMVDVEGQPVMITYQNGATPQQTVKPLAAALLQSAIGAGYTVLELPVGDIGVVSLRVNVTPQIIEG